MHCAFCLRENARLEGGCCDEVYCNERCKHKDITHKFDCISAKPPPQQGVDLSTLAVAPNVLGEGSFGCVLKSADGRWAIKVQDSQSTDICAYESGLQNQLGLVVPNAAIARVYTYGVDIPYIPPGWRSALLNGCQKARVWAERNWTGKFCITIMDFLPGKAPRSLEARNVPLFCFALLYTVTQGYEKMQFQHLDIKPANIILIPQPLGKETYRICGAQESEWKFSGINAVPRMVDFGLSTTTNMPSSIDPLKNKGATLMITPFEVVVGRIQPRPGNGAGVRDFMHTVGKKRYHWSYDLFSIGITVLEAVLTTRPDEVYSMKMIMDAMPYINAFLQRYGIQPNAPEAQQPGMVLMYMYNLCIIQHLLGNGAYPQLTDNTFDAYYPPGTVGYDLLRTQKSIQIINYIVAKNVSLFQADIAKFKQTFGDNGLSLVASLLHWNPEKRGGGKGRVLFHPFFNAYRSAIKCSPDGKVLQDAQQKQVVVGVKGNDERKRRIARHVQTLFHQTSPEAAESIIGSQTFRLGKSGMVGGGIYFAASVTDTDRKAETKGVILQADVLLGRTKTITRPDYNMNFERLLIEGYDSVFIMTNSGPEYVVYNPDQVRNVRYAMGPDILNRELTIMYPGMQVAKVLMLAIGAGAFGYLAFLGRDTRTQQYRLFGGTHDRKRSRGDNARHEWCEEFGAFLQGPDILCNPPTFEELKDAPKIFQNGRVGKGGPPKTNIIILMDVDALSGNNNVDVFKWNKNNQAVRAKPGTPADYKEIDKLISMDLSDLIQVANATPPGMIAEKRNEYTISAETLQAVRDLHAAKMFGKKK